MYNTKLCTECKEEVAIIQISDFKFLCDDCLKWHLENKVHYCKFEMEGSTK